MLGTSGKEGDDARPAAHRISRLVRSKFLRRTGTKRAAARLGCMRRSSDQDSDGVATGLAMHLCLYCAAAACFAFGLFYLMQPTRLVNPGLAYKPPSPTVAHCSTEREAITPVAGVEPEPETVGASAPQQPEPKKAKAQVKTQSPSRARPVRRPQPAEPLNYAYQPFFGGYRPMY
jgi:hypothetical protein